MFVSVIISVNTPYIAVLYSESLVIGNLNLFFVVFLLTLTHGAGVWSSLIVSRGFAVVRR